MKIEKNLFTRRKEEISHHRSESVRLNRDVPRYINRMLINRH